MELTLLVEEAEKEGEMIPKGSFEGVFNVLMNRHLPEHIFYNHLERDKATQDFKKKYEGLARKMYVGCFGSGKAIFDTDKYSCGRFGVAEKVFLDVMNEFIEGSSRKAGFDPIAEELKFIQDYAFLAREIFCESCSRSSSCVDYKNYIAGQGWKSYIHEPVAVAGE